MRSILLWLIGIPIPIILLLAFCTHHLLERAAALLTCDGCARMLAMRVSDECIRS